MGLGISASACGRCLFWVLVSVLQRADCVMHVHVFSCAYVFVYVCVWIYVYVHFFCSGCYLHFTGVLGTSAWAGVNVTQVCFYTNVHICEHTCCRLCTHVYMYIYVYMHAYAYGCICASMI